jgi:C4-dicarboxylate-specific signal transduction histidine kinase
MSSVQNPLTPPEEQPETRSFRTVTTLGRMAEWIAKELNESLCAIVINASICLRMLSADPPNVEGARETARRTIRASNRAAEAVSHLRALFSETNKRIETVAPSRGGSSRVAQGGTL